MRHGWEVELVLAGETLAIEAQHGGIVGQHTVKRTEIKRHTKLVHTRMTPKAKTKTKDKATKT